MENTVKQRLIEYISYKDMSIRSFERTVGLSTGFVNNISKSIGADKLLSILSKFPDLNTGWLLTGEGEMLKSAPPAPEQRKPGRIIYYPDVDGTMGNVTFEDAPDEHSRLEIVIPGYEDCTHAINAYGDSMYPLIESGQIVVMKLWEESFFDWGNIYFIVTKSGYRTIKRVYPSERDGFVQLRSENAAKHPPFEIDASEIVRCFIVKGWICRSVI